MVSCFSIDILTRWQSHGRQLLDRQFHLRALLQRGLGHRPAELLGRRLQLGDVLRTRAAAARDGRWVRWVDQVIGNF